MALTLKKAQRSKAYLKLGLSAPSGGGKTAGSLLVAYGMMKRQYPELSDAEIWEKIGIADTENGSGELYVGSTIGRTKIGVYNAITIAPPYTPEKYEEAIDLMLENGIEVCILDSTTHLWSGEGGLLEQQQLATKRTGNSYTAWRDITPKHNAFVDKMVHSPIHIIATMRAKQEYTQEKNEAGKTIVRKLGMEPEQRKGMEYEFTVFLEVDSEHNAFGAKDRTSIFDQQTFRITPDVGTKLMDWLMSGVDTAPVIVAQTIEKADPEEVIKSLKEEIVNTCKTLGGSGNESLMEVVRRFAPDGNPFKIKDVNVLKEFKTALADYEATREIPAE